MRPTPSPSQPSTPRTLPRSRAALAALLFGLAGGACGPMEPNDLAGSAPGDGLAQRRQALEAPEFLIGARVQPTTIVASSAHGKVFWGERAGVHETYSWVRWAWLDGSGTWPGVFPVSGDIIEIQELDGSLYVYSRSSSGSHSLVRADLRADASLDRLFSLVSLPPAERIRGFALSTRGVVVNVGTSSFARIELIDHSGAARRTLYSGPLGVGVAADSRFAYFTRYRAVNQSIDRISLDGGGVRTLARNQVGVHGLVRAAGELFYANMLDGRIMKLTGDNLVRELFTMAPSQMTPLVVAQGRVFWRDGASLHSGPAAGGGPTQTQTQTQTQTHATDALGGIGGFTATPGVPHVYFTNIGADPTRASGGIWRSILD